MASQTDHLLKKPYPEATGNLDEGGVLLEEYGSIALAVVENVDNEPVVVHDFTGPVILEPGAMERRYSFEESICSVQDEETVFPPPDSADKQGQATIASEISTMAKNIIGCGVLSLSGGISLAANNPAAIFAANFWILLLGAIFGYFCYLIAKVCEMTGRTTYRGIWQETIGPRGAVAVSISNALKASLADLAYASILADTTKSLFASTGLHLSRGICLILITLVAILPLCMLKNLHVLAPFSALGTGGVIVTALAMAVRYLDGSYLPGGQYHNDILPSLQPSFGTNNQAWGPAMLPFVCMVYESYVMHYNSARFYTELKDRTLPRFAVAVGSSFGISAIVYMGIASCGFLTFGAHSDSFILNNYSPNDPLAIISRLAVGISTLTAYPIVFHGVRDGVLDVLECPFSDQTHENLNRLTLILLSLLTLTAMFVTDLGLINAVGGGLVTTPIVFVFPTLMFRAASKMQLGGYFENRREIGLASVLTGMGAVIGIVGAWIAIKGAT